MWDIRTIGASRGILGRLLIMLCSTLLIAVFACIGLSKPVAAADAVWTGSALTYESNTYTPISVTGLPTGDVKDKIPYAWINTAITPQKASVLYFDDKDRFFTDVDNPLARTSAILIVYDFKSPNTYSNGTSPVTITVLRDLTVDSNDQNQEHQNTCDGSITKGMGWVMCPLSNWIADAIDGIYKIVSNFLEVRTLVSRDTGVYQLWDLVRNLANICFIIIFLVIIYSHLTSMGYSNHNIKDMLPRLIIGAILVNLSFHISALAVDTSNLFGYSIQHIIANVRENLPTGADMSSEFNWVNITTFILSGGSVVGGLAALGGATGFAPGAMALLLLSGLLTAGFAVLTAFIILSARQALIVIFTIISPLAFVAFVLPSTKSWYSKWQKAFVSLLIFFPIFSLLFGGSQLAGAAIMNSSHSAQDTMKLPLVLIGLAVQFIPLIITPIILRLSTGILGQIANITNNKNKGFLDRTRNSLKDRADASRLKALQKNDNIAGRNNMRGWLSPRAIARRSDMKRREREADKKMYEEGLANRFEHQRNRRLQQPPQSRADQARQIARHRAHEEHLLATEYKTLIDEHDKEAWNARSQTDAQVRVLRMQSTQQTDAAKRAETEWNAIIEELRAEGQLAPSAVGQSARETQIAESLRTLALDNELRTQRLNSAKMRQEEKITEMYKSETNDPNGHPNRTYAGGIAGERGANRVYARARSKTVSDMVEAVKNNRSVLTEYTLQQLMTLHQNGVSADGVGNASEEMRLAAMQEILLKKGNHFSVQKTRDIVAMDGMIYDDTANQYYDVARNADGTVILGANGRAARGRLLDADEVELRRDRQQMFVDTYNQSKHAIKNVSGTDRGDFETGIAILTSQDAIIRDIRDDKFKAARLVESDVDELARMVEIFRDPAIRGRISPQLRQKVVERIQEAQTDPQLKGQIEGRQRDLMNMVASYLDDTDTRSDREKETIYFEDPSTGARVSPGTPGARPVDIHKRAPVSFNLGTPGDPLPPF